VIIGSGSSTSVLDLIAAVRDVTGAELPSYHGPAKAGEMVKVIVDIGRARALGWQPTVSLHDGLARVWSSRADDANLAIPDLDAARTIKG
jgi:UDP-glucose 4-epimerase